MCSDISQARQKAEAVTLYFNCIMNVPEFRLVHSVLPHPQVIKIHQPWPQGLTNTIKSKNHNSGFCLLGKLQIFIWVLKASFSIVPGRYQQISGACSARMQRGPKEVEEPWRRENESLTRSPRCGRMSITSYLQPELCMKKTNLPYPNWAEQELEAPWGTCSGHCGCGSSQWAAGRGHWMTGRAQERARVASDVKAPAGSPGKAPGWPEQQHWRWGKHLGCPLTELCHHHRQSRAVQRAQEEPGFIPGPVTCCRSRL